MNLQDNVSHRMDYIQKLFLDVERSVEKINDLKDITALLNEEPPEFRSVAYESASMVIALRELGTKKTLQSWKEFRQTCSTEHSFHTDIGLGWAFAKTDLQPDNFLKSVNPVVKWMVFDGIGYYHGLFKGRSSVKKKIIPSGVEGESIKGFDQGLGRRLWYITKGDVIDLLHLLQGFNATRHADLWRGAGIACGYVGGCQEDNLAYLSSASGAYNSQFKLGIMLAAMSRIASHSINEDVRTACRIVCNKTIEQFNLSQEKIAENFFYLYKKSDDNSDWLSQLNSTLVSNQTIQADLTYNEPK
jgi:hypothetical protein